MTCRILPCACFDEAWKNHAWLVSTHVYNVVTSPVGHCAPSRCQRCLATNNNIIYIILCGDINPRVEQSREG